MLKMQKCLFGFVGKHTIGDIYNQLVSFIWLQKIRLCCLFVDL